MTELPTNTDKWIEVDLDAIGHNLREIRRIMQPGTRLMAVVKANAYGLGAVPVAGELVRLGVDLLGVTFLREALQLRYNGIDEDIMVFSPLLPQEYPTAIDHNIIVSVGSAMDLSLVEKAAAEAGKRARVHIKIDTGLGRFGLEPDEAEPVIRDADASELIDLEGIYTHFAAGVEDAYTVKQFNRFHSLLDSLEKQGISIPLRHCCSSSSFLRHPHMHLDMVRLGTVLYGQFPAGKVMPGVNLRECFRFKARIAAVRYFKRGSYLGYYRTYRLPHDSRVAVIPVGLVDGFGVEAVPKPADVIDLIKMGIKLLASYFNLNRTALTATINGRPVYIRGKVFMQFCLAEIPPGLEVSPGDEVELPVKRTLASLAVPRSYLREGRSRTDDNDMQPGLEPGFGGITGESM